MVELRVEIRLVAVITPFLYPEEFVNFVICIFLQRSAEQNV